jgi:HK97 family phage major capsid protein
MALGSTTVATALPTLLDPTLIHTGTAAKDPLRSVSRVIQARRTCGTASASATSPRTWVAENTALSDGTPTFANPSVTAAKLTAFLTASYEIFEDSDLQAQMPGLIAEAFSFAEQTAFVVGSGSNAPKGIVTAISATAGSTVTVTTRGAFTSASSADVFALVAAVPALRGHPHLGREQVVVQHGPADVDVVAGFVLLDELQQRPRHGRPPLLGSPTVQASDMNTAFASGTVRDPR